MSRKLKPQGEPGIYTTLDGSDHKGTFKGQAVDGRLVFEIPDLPAGPLEGSWHPGWDTKETLLGWA